MNKGFAVLVEKLTAVTASSWLFVGVLLLLAIGLTVMLKKRSGMKMVLALWIVAVGAIIAVLLFSSPNIDIEQGAGTTATFLYNPVFWALIIGLGGLLILFLLMRKQVFTVRMLSSGALCVALAFILSCITLWRLPQGGSITPASMLPIFVFAYLYGPVPGIAAGAVDGLLQLLQGAYVIHPVQFLLDYILPFAVLGCAGLFRKDKQLPLGIAVGSFLRFSLHVLSGVVFFYMYAPVGQNVWLYSIIYNGTYMLPETVICLAIAMLPGVNRSLSRLKTQMNS